MKYKNETVTAIDLIEALKECHPDTPVLVHVAGSEGYSIGTINAFIRQFMDGTEGVLLQCTAENLEPYSQADEGGWQ